MHESNKIKNSYVCVWEARLRFPNARFVFSILFFFFFFLHAFWSIFLLFIHCCAVIFDFSSWTVHTQTHKLHFSVTFSLKMYLTVLFTYLKIILLQCFLVFNFQLYPNWPYTKELPTSTKFNLGYLLFLKKAKKKKKKI